MLDADGVARRVLREAELIVSDVRERAEAAAGRPGPPAPASSAGPVDDSDLRMLRLMLARDSRAGRLLREHGIDEAAIDAALAPREP